MKVIISIPFIIIGLIILTLYQSNYFQEIKKVTPKNCIKIIGMQGPEDIDNINNNLIISISDLLDEKINKKLGGIARHNTISKKTINLTKNVNRQLNIHGIRVYKENDKLWYIYAINHGSKNDDILIFKYSNETIELERTINSSLTYNLNDIEVLSKNRFLVTRDHFFKNKYLKVIENFFRFGLSKTLYFNGTNFIELSNRFTFANGISLIDKSTIAIASMLNKKIEIYNIKDILNVKKIKQFDLDFFPDNITFNKSANTLLIAGHKKIFTLRRHSQNPQNVISPSKAISLDLNTMKQKVILSEDSPLFSGVSTLKELNGKYYFGNIFQNYIVECSI